MQRVGSTRAWLLMLTLLFTACAGQPAATEANAPPNPTQSITEQASTPVSTPPAAPDTSIPMGAETAGLVAALGTAGAQVERGQAVDQPFFSPPGQVLLVDQAEVQVFEYASEAERETESGAIAPDGSAIGPSKPAWTGLPNFWARGKLIVLYVGQEPQIIQRLVRVLGRPLTGLAAAPQATLPAVLPSPTGIAGGQGLPGPYPEAVQQAAQNLADLLAIPTQEVQVSAYEQTQWPDSCLGLAKPGEMCLQVITPGWQVVLAVGGQTYEYHTDESGNRLRLKAPAGP